MAGEGLVNNICGSGKQPVQRGSAVPEIAQLYAYALFRMYFRNKYPAGGTYHDWDIIQRNVATGRPIIDRAADRIRTDLRNYVSKSAKNLAKARAGNFSALAEGREVRGDGIGLAIDPSDRKIVC